MFTEWLNRLLYLVRRSRFDVELDRELQFHLETRADELEAEGLGREAAMARARREFGPHARTREEVRSAWQFRVLEDLAGDIRYAARAFRRNPAFAATAIVCLARASAPIPRCSASRAKCCSAGRRRAIRSRWRRSG
jgi:hypothetical protein